MAKAVKKQAMGRGLSALLKNSAEDIQSIKDRNADKVVGTIVEIELSSIEVNPYQHEPILMKKIYENLPAP